MFRYNLVKSVVIAIMPRFLVENAENLIENSAAINKIGNLYINL